EGEGERLTAFCWARPAPKTSPISAHLGAKPALIFFARRSDAFLFSFLSRSHPPRQQHHRQSSYLSSSPPSRPLRDRFSTPIFLPRLCSRQTLATNLDMSSIP